MSSDPSFQLTMPLPSRLFPVTKIIFDAINQAGTKGIIVGGAAAYMLGSKRATKVGILSLDAAMENLLVP